MDLSWQAILVSFIHLPRPRQRKWCVEQSKIVSEVNKGTIRIPKPWRPFRSPSDIAFRWRSGSNIWSFTCLRVEVPLREDGVPDCRLRGTCGLPGHIRCHRLFRCLQTERTTFHFRISSGRWATSTSVSVQQFWANCRNLKNKKNDGFWNVVWVKLSFS